MLRADVRSGHYVHWLTVSTTHVAPSCDCWAMRRQSICDTNAQPLVSSPIERG